VDCDKLQGVPEMKIAGAVSRTTGADFRTNYEELTAMAPLYTGWREMPLENPDSSK
jgi:hypothetical protein